MRIGDWEVDALLGKGHRQAIVNLTKRKSRYALLQKVDQRAADQVGDAVIELLQPVKDRLYILTANNGKEFADHERITRDLQADLFFAHPFSAWERGANENVIGLLRQYSPKKHDLGHITNEDLVLVMKRLYHRPRLCLDFLSPYQVFYNQFIALTDRIQDFK